MDGLSERLNTAIHFLRKNGYAGSYGEIANKLNVTNSTLSMTMNGTRVPTWEMLLNFCDIYPIDFWWIRTGDGSMIKGRRELELLKRIDELETELRRLKE